MATLQMATNSAKCPKYWRPNTRASACWSKLFHCSSALSKINQHCRVCDRGPQCHPFARHDVQCIQRAAVWRRDNTAGCITRLQNLQRRIEL